MIGQSTRTVSAAGDAIEVEGIGRTLSVRIASGCDDYEQAFLLLSEKYRGRGYDEPGLKLYRFTPFHVLPGTITVVARDGARVVATLSMVPDTRLLGLPMESIFGEEVDGLRRQGRRLAEVTSLADDGLSRREFLGVFSSMAWLIHQAHIRNGGDTWVVAVNPRHASFYRKGMGAIPLGDRRSYPAVHNAPAEAFVTDEAIMKANSPEMFDRVFGRSLPSTILNSPQRDSDHVEFFGQHSTVADRRTIREIARAVEAHGGHFRWQEHRTPAAHPARRHAAA